MSLSHLMDRRESRTLLLLELSRSQGPYSPLECLFAQGDRHPHSLSQVLQEEAEELREGEVGVAKQQLSRRVRL